VAEYHEPAWEAFRALILNEGEGEGEKEKGIVVRKVEFAAWE
jgi:hypothetical protein